LNVTPFSSSAISQRLEMAAPMRSRQCCATGEAGSERHPRGLRACGGSAGLHEASLKSDQLAKYLSPQGYESIFTGKGSHRESPEPERADCLLFGHRGLRRDDGSAGIQGPDPAEALSDRDVADRRCLCAMFKVPIKRPQHVDAICRIGPSS